MASGNRVKRSSGEMSPPASTWYVCPLLASAGRSAYSGTTPTSPEVRGRAGPERMVRALGTMVSSATAEASMPCPTQTASATAPAPSMPAPELAGSSTTTRRPEFDCRSEARPSQVAPSPPSRFAVAASLTMKKGLVASTVLRACSPFMASAPGGAMCSHALSSAIHASAFWSRATAAAPRPSAVVSWTLTHWSPSARVDARLRRTGAKAVAETTRTTREQSAGSAVAAGPLLAGGRPIAVTAPVTAALPRTVSTRTRRTTRPRLRPAFSCRPTCVRSPHEPRPRRPTLILGTPLMIHLDRSALRN